MARRSWALLAGLLLAWTVSARAADDIAPGNYKLSVLGPGQQFTLWLIKLEEKDGKWSGEILSTNKRIQLPKTTLGDVTVKDGLLKLNLKAEGERFSFEGKQPADGKKIVGTVKLQELLPAQLEPTTIKSLEPIDLAREVMAQPNPNGPELFDAATTLMRQAAAKKAKPEEVRGWASKASKAAETYGPRWQLEYALRVADILASQEEYAAEAVQYARQAERLLPAGSKPPLQKRVLTTVATALKKAGKEEEAKELEAKAEKLPLVAVAKYPPRTGKNDNVVLVELFTGAECPPCVAADLAFDALGKTYTPKEAILLQYHLHIPGPDPLTNADAEARQKFYGDDIEGTPTIFLNGQVGPGGGGRKSDAHDKYEAFVEAINPLLDKPAPIKLTATAERKGGKIDIAAEVSGIDKPEDKLRLRFALTEEVVKYTGGNKLDAHHHVVRAFPGGAKGFAIKEKGLKQTASVDIVEVRKSLTKYLDEYAKETPFPNKERPLDLKNLRVVAFVQNDGTKEVLQAVQVEIKDDKE